MKDGPFSFMVQAPDFIPSGYDHHIRRTLRDMEGQYHDQQAYQQMLSREDSLLYEVYEQRRPEVEGELLHGISIIHPGKVGDEYFMTKGHYHTVLETAEIYYTLQGSGMMVMETPEGEWAAERLEPGGVLYVPPRWAHRSVNLHPTQDLVMLFAYPANAGHDYGTIETLGFRKLVLDQDGQPVVRDNPRWEKGAQ